MGCVNSTVNQPPRVVRPKPRAQQSDIVVLTELSDLSDEALPAVHCVPTYVGRQNASKGFLQTTQKEQLEHQVKRDNKLKQQELKQRQEDLLRKNVEQQKLQFQLNKEKEANFKLKQERIHMEELAKKPIAEQKDNLNSSLYSDESEPTTKLQRFSQFNLTGVTKTGWGIEDIVVEEMVDDPDPKPPSYRKKDIAPNLNEFTLFDKHAVKTPPGARSSVSTLVNHLKQTAENQFQLVRMFYRWITFHISFDVEGYYGEVPKQPTEAEAVLRNGTTISEGYANVMEAMCRFAGIPVKVVHGVVKGYDFKVGDLVSLTDSHITHTWNAVYINGNWFFIDCAWGAGHVDIKRKWHRQYQEFYFIVDPDKMIVDHFPFMDGDLRSSSNWQLLVSPVSANSFSQRLKLERGALEWDVKPVTHTQHHIITVRREVELQLQEVGDKIEDYTVSFQRKDGSKNLDSYFLAYKENERTLKVLIRPPQEIDFVVSIFGKKSLDAKGKAEVLVTYILKCTEVQFQLRQFPTNYRLFGAVPDISKLGFCKDITKCVQYTSNSGELVLPFKTKRVVQCMTKLEHITEKKDLTNYCLVTGKERGISIKIRLPFEGYYKFTLFGKQSENGNFRPVATFLIDCNQATHVHCGFPVAFDEALNLQCSLYKPLWKDLPANSQITIVLGCPNLARVQVLFTPLERDDNDVFEGTITTPAAGQPFTIYGQKEFNSPLIGLYHFTIF